MLNSFFLKFQLRLCTSKEQSQQATQHQGIIEWCALTTRSHGLPQAGPRDNTLMEP